MESPRDPANIDIGKSVEQNEQLFRLLVEGVKDYAIFMIDAEGRIMSWNAGAELLKGYRADEIMGELIGRFYPEEDRQNNKPRRLLEIAAKEGRAEDEGWRIRKDGSPFWADVVITALHNDAGELVGFAKVTRDLTEHRRAEEALRKAHEELERRVAERTRELEKANESLMEKNNELEKFADAVIGRELKMMELEKLVESLQQQLQNFQRTQGSH